jgi:hypothetical protein
LKKLLKKWVGGEAQGVGPELKAPVLQKKQKQKQKTRAPIQTYRLSVQPNHSCGLHTILHSLFCTSFNKSYSSENKSNTFIH